MSKQKFTKEVISKIADLSHIPLDQKEEEYFASQFNKTLEIIEELNSFDTKKISETSQVTGLLNVFRKDVINKDKMLSQDEALSNSKKTYKGYFLVPAIFNNS